MARLIGPDESVRTVYLTEGDDRGKALAQGLDVPLWLDEDLTQPATGTLLESGAAIAGSPPTVQVDQYSQIPVLQYPNKARKLYSRIGDDGPVFELPVRPEELVGLDPDRFTGSDYDRVQQALDYSIANDFPALIFRRSFDITGEGPLMVEKTTWTDRRVVWLMGQGGGLVKTDAGAMLSSSTLNMGDVSLRNMRLASTNGAGTIVFDCDKLIRLSSIGNEYHNIDRIAATTGDTIINRIQSLALIGDHVIGGTGHAISAVRTFDIAVYGCLVEDRHGGLITNRVGTGTLQNNALRVRDTVVENCLGLGPDGAPIILGACWATVLDGNYYEQNHSTTTLPDVDLHTLASIGHFSVRIESNHHTRSQVQKDANAAAVWVGLTSTPVISAGNISEGLLYDMKTAPGGFTPLGSITSLGGDYSTTGRVYLRANHATGYGVPTTNLATPSGPTSERPAAPRLQQQYFDTTLGKPIWCTAIGTRPQHSIVISAGATSSGNITIGLFGTTALTVAVTAGDTITQVRDKIAAAVVQGWFTGTLSTDRVLFIRDVPQSATLPTFSGGTTGVTQSSITLDVVAVGATWVDATGATV